MAIRIENTPLQGKLARWALPALLIGALVSAGCGDSSLSSVSGATADSSVQAPIPQLNAELGFSVPLNAGWNTIAFRTVDLSSFSLTGAGTVTGYHYYHNGVKVSVAGAPTLASLTSAGIPPKAIRILAPSGGLTLNYNGTSLASTSTISLQTGSNLVSFASDTPVAASTLVFSGGTGSGASTNLSSTVVTEYNQNGTGQSVNIATPTTMLQPGKAYVLNSQGPRTLTYGTASGAVTLTGKITYARILPKTTATADDSLGASSVLDFPTQTPLPCRFVKVQALSAADVILATGNTNATGDYTLPVGAGSGQIKIRVFAETVTVAGESGPIRIQDNTNSFAGYASDSTLNDRTVSTVNLFLPSGYTTALDGGQTPANQFNLRPGGAFSCLDGFLTAYRYWIAGGVDPTTLPMVRVNWSVKNTSAGVHSDYPYADGRVPTSFFTSGPNELVILGDSGVDTDEYDWHVLVHEFAHWFQFNRFRADSPGGSHSGGDIKDPRLAFGEGFGNAMGAITPGAGGGPGNDPVYQDTSNPQGFAQSGEFNQNSSDGDPGWFSESTVQSLLIDLFDGTRTEGSGYVDNLSFGPATLVTAMDFQKTSKSLTTIFPFLQSVFSTSTPTEQSNILTLMATFTKASDPSNFGINSVDEFGVGETHGAGISATSLPVYTTLNSGSNSIPVPGQKPGGLVNWLSGNRYVKFTPSADGTVSLTVPTGSVSISFYENGIVNNSIFHESHFPVNTTAGKTYVLVLTNDNTTAANTQITITP